MSRQRVAQEHGGGDGGGPVDEMRQARENAARAQRRYDAEGDKEEALRRHRLRPDLSGTWTFINLLNTSNELLGWRVEFNNVLVGMITMRGADLVVISASEEYDEDAPSADQIMVAFMAGPGKGMGR